MSRAVRKRTRQIRGFTLIELMVVVVIIGILAIIGIPKFTENGRRARQSEADLALKSIHQLQEAYRVKNGSFASDFTGANSLEEVGWEAPALQYFDPPTLADVTGTTYTACLQHNATSGADLENRSIDQDGQFGTC